MLLAGSVHQPHRALSDTYGAPYKSADPDPYEECPGLVGDKGTVQVHAEQLAW